MRLRNKYARLLNIFPVVAAFLFSVVFSCVLSFLAVWSFASVFFPDRFSVEIDAAWIAGLSFISLLQTSTWVTESINSLWGRRDGN